MPRPRRRSNRPPRVLFRLRSLPPSRRKVPVRVDLLGTVTPIAGVAVKTLVDTEVKVARVDGLAIHS